MAKKTESITIPMSLARMLVAEPEDLKKSEDYENLQELAKSMLKLLIATTK